MPLLRSEIEQGLATIVLNNPPQNRLTPQMVDELCEIVNVVGKSEARAVLLYAEGPDFSFGGDIVPWPAMSPRELRTLFERYLSAFNQFERMPIPTVAAVQIYRRRHVARRDLSHRRTRGSFARDRMGANLRAGAGNGDGTIRRGQPHR